MMWNFDVDKAQSPCIVATTSGHVGEAYRYGGHGSWRLRSSDHGPFGHDIVAWQPLPDHPGVPEHLVPKKRPEKEYHFVHPYEENTND